MLSPYLTEGDVTSVKVFHDVRFAFVYYAGKAVTILFVECFSVSHTCQLSEIFMGETACESTFLTHFFFTTKRAGKISWNFHGGDIFLTYKQA